MREWWAHSPDLRRTQTCTTTCVNTTAAPTPAPTPAVSVSTFIGLEFPELALDLRWREPLGFFVNLCLTPLHGGHSGSAGVGIFLSIIGNIVNGFGYVIQNLGHYQATHCEPSKP